jgi:hypothetical protein
MEVIGAILLLLLIFFVFGWLKGQAKRAASKATMAGVRKVAKSVAKDDQSPSGSTQVGD